MALQLPQDVSGTPFVTSGLLAIDGSLFTSGKISSTTFGAEVDRVGFNLAISPIMGLRTRYEWTRVRDAVILYSFTDRTPHDISTINHLLDACQIFRQPLPQHSIAFVLAVIEAAHNECRPEPQPTNPNITQPPAQRLPSANVPPTIVYTDVVSNAHGYDIGWKWECAFACKRDNTHFACFWRGELSRHLRQVHGYPAGFQVTGRNEQLKRWQATGPGSASLTGRIIQG